MYTVSLLTEAPCTVSIVWEHVVHIVSALTCTFSVHFHCIYIIIVHLRFTMQFQCPKQCTMHVQRKLSVHILVVSSPNMQSISKLLYALFR